MKQTFGFVFDSGTVNGIENCIILSPTNEDQMQVVLSPDEAALLIRYLREYV